MVNLDLYTLLVTKLYYIIKICINYTNTNAISTTHYDTIKYLKSYKILSVISLCTKIIYCYYHHYYHHHFYMCTYPNLHNFHILRTQYLLLPN
jgi:hypothetical protein